MWRLVPNVPPGKQNSDPRHGRQISGVHISYLTQISENASELRRSDGKKELLVRKYIVENGAKTLMNKKLIVEMEVEALLTHRKISGYH